MQSRSRGKRCGRSSRASEAVKVKRVAPAVKVRCWAVRNITRVYSAPVAEIVVVAVEEAVTQAAAGEALGYLARYRTEGAMLKLITAESTPFRTLYSRTLSHSTACTTPVLLPNAPFLTLILSHY